MYGRSEEDEDIEGRPMRKTRGNDLTASTRDVAQLLTFAERSASSRARNVLCCVACRKNWLSLGRRRTTENTMTVNVGFFLLRRGSRLKLSREIRAVLRDPS